MPRAENDRVVGGHVMHAAKSSLPGLTRQSIIFEKRLAKKMDARVKPAHDDTCIFPHHTTV
jgi:hypothetical protein